MPSSQCRPIAPALCLMLLMGTSVHAVAATGFTACAGEKNSEDRVATTLVDYNSPALAEDAAEILDDPSSIAATQIPLTSSVDTSIRRDDAVKSDLELPLGNDTELEQKPDAAALLLERRNAQPEDAGDGANPEVTTEFPGMNSDDMLQLRHSMYRTDI